jgi:hypothetical protein
MMNKPSFLALAIAVASTTVATTASAQPMSHSLIHEPTAYFAPPPSPKGTMRTPIATVVNEDSQADIPALVGLFVNTDALTRIKCAEPNGCTIIFRLWAQVLAPANSAWGLCPEVDGMSVPSACQSLGMATPTTFDSRSAFGTFQVAKGQHQVRTMVRMGAGGTLYAYHYEYELTTP